MTHGRRSLNIDVYNGIMSGINEFVENMTLADNIPHLIDCITERLYIMNKMSLHEFNLGKPTTLDMLLKIV